MGLQLHTISLELIIIVYTKVLGLVRKPSQCVCCK